MDRPSRSSFWLADPPDVSHFSVHCPGISHEDFAHPPPFVIAAEGAFVLLCVTLDGSDHHFVYSARGNPTGKKKKKNKPSLHVLPDPKPAVEGVRKPAVRSPPPRRRPELRRGLP
jgi:hypothetical protein